MNAFKSGQNEASYIPDDATLKIMYEDEKNHKIKRIIHETTKSIIINCYLYNSIYNSLETDP